MGLLRIVILHPTGTPLPGLRVSLHQKELTESSAATTDAEGMARFWVQPGSYNLEFESLPNVLQPPKRGTVVTLGDFTEGAEQIIRLQVNHTHTKAAR